MSERTYVCIDLKSFYASVECADRGLNPFTENLVVADKSRGRTTICLAITPALKRLGVRNRCRLFEIPEGIPYRAARPRMRRYMEVSAAIYSIYLRWVSPEDVHVYSIDECFIDVTPYLTLYRTDARSFALMLMGAVHAETGVSATAGIGTNLFLSKVALDVMAKHAPDGIGQLDEQSFKRDLWFHRPITDIWGIGPGIARRLARRGAQDLAGVAALRPASLYREFGVNAEYLIDHSWGQEPCTIKDIKRYVPEAHSLTNGQVLPCDYTADEARVVLREMVQASVLDLVSTRMVTDHISLSIGYARQPGALCGAPCVDTGHGLRPVRGLAYGAARTGGSRKIARRTNSLQVILSQFEQLFTETTHPDVPVRRIVIGMGGLLPERQGTATLFDNLEAEEKEHALQEALLQVRGRFGKNAMLRGTSLQGKATAQERNEQVGGHRA